MAAVRQHYKLATTGKLGQKKDGGGKSTSGKKTLHESSGKKSTGGYGKKSAS